MNDDPLTGQPCPMCARRGDGLYGPRFKPRRWYRRVAFWRCSWCHYEWREPSDD